MAKRNHKTRKQPTPKQKREQNDMALLDTVQNRTWLAAYPKWRHEQTKFDFLPLEMLIEIFDQLDPVDAYAFVKANYPRLEGVWKTYGSRKTQFYNSDEAFDTQVAFISSVSAFCWQWFWSPTAWASNGYDSKPGKLYYNTYILAPSTLQNKPFKTIAEAPKTKPRQSPCWQDRLCFWLDQIFVQHMERCHPGNTAMDIIKCLYTCASISVFSTKAQLNTKDGSEDERWMDTHCTPHTTSTWPDSKCIAINLDSGGRSYDSQFRDGNGEQNECLLLTFDDVKRLVRNRQMRALQRQFEWNEKPFDGELREEVFGWSRVLWDSVGGIVSDEEAAEKMWVERHERRVDRERGLMERGMKLNWFLQAGLSLERRLRKKEKEEAAIESEVGGQDDGGDGDGDEEKKTLSSSSTSEPLSAIETENSHQCRGCSDSFARPGLHKHSG